MFNKEKQQIVEENFQCIRDVVLLSGGANTVPPLCVQQAYVKYMTDLVSTHAVGKENTSVKMAERARNHAAKLFNCEPNDLAFVKNTTEGIGIIAASNLFKAGDSIVICDSEHATNMYAWVHLREKGVKLNVVHSSHEYLPYQGYIDAVDENTKAIVLSSVQYKGGIRTDLKALGAFCKEKGILLIVDAIQSGGRMKIDVKEMNISWMACGGHKGLMGLNGVGFVYCCPELQKKVFPVYASYHSVDKPYDLANSAPDVLLDWHPNARRFETGNQNYAGYYCLDASVNFINTLGIENIEEHILSLENYLIEKIAPLGLHTSIQPEQERRSGIFVVFFPTEKKEAVEAALDKYKVLTTMRNDNFRICIGLYNTVEDMDTAAKALAEVAEVLK